MQAINQSALLKCCLIFIISFICTHLSIANNKVDQLILQLELTQDEPSKLTILDTLINQTINTNHTQAGQYLAQAFSIIEKHNMSERKAGFLIKKAKINYLNGKPAESLTILNGVCNSFKNTGDSLHTDNIKSQQLMARIYNDKGDVKKAHHLYTRSLALSKIIRDTTLMGYGANGIGVSFYLEGNHEQALIYYLEGHKYLKNSKGNGAIRLAIINNIALIFEKTGEDEKAIKYYNKGIKLAEETNNIYIAPSLLYNAFASLSKLGRYKEAEQKLLQSLKISNEHSFKIDIAWSYFGLAELYTTTNKLNKAKNNYLLALDGFTSLNDTLQRGAVLSKLGDIYSKQEDIEKALSYFSEAEKIINKSDYYSLKMSIYDRMATMYAQTDNYNQAYTYLNQLRAIEKDHFSQENNKKVLELQSKFETEARHKDQENQIAKLEAEKAIKHQQWLFTFIVAILLFIMMQYLSYHNRQKQKINRILNIAKEKAEEAERKKTSFLSTMSHEIRTPMNGVIGMSNILMGENPRPDQIKNLEVLNFSANNLLHLINDILDFSKIDANKIELEENEFSLEMFLENTFNLFNKGSLNKNINVALDLQTEGLGKYVIGDKYRLAQIINNLMSNALKFTSEGSITLTAQAKLLDKHKANVYFAVKDTGIGIPLDKQEEIFKDFTQGGKNISREYGGTGLGLGISKKLVSLFGGTLQVDSTPEKGSTFYFNITLPLGKKIVKQTIISPMKQVCDSYCLLDRHILIAEDNKVNQMVARKILEKWNAKISIVENGQQAIDAVKQNNFDLILMDIQMPVMDGLEATQKIRNLKSDKRHIPILALTASAHEIAGKLEVYQINDIISKPFLPKELYAKIMKEINQTKGLGS